MESLRKDEALLKTQMINKQCGATESRNALGFSLTPNRDRLRTELLQEKTNISWILFEDAEKSLN